MFQVGLNNKNKVQRKKKNQRGAKEQHTKTVQAHQMKGIRKVTQEIFGGKGVDNKVIMH